MVQWLRVLFQRTWVQFPISIWQLITVYYPSPRGPDGPLLSSTDTRHINGAPTHKKAKHSYILKEKFLIKSTKCRTLYNTILWKNSEIRQSYIVGEYEDWFCHSQNNMAGFSHYPQRSFSGLPDTQGDVCDLGPKSQRQTGIQHWRNS